MLNHCCFHMKQLVLECIKSLHQSNCFNINSNQSYVFNPILHIIGQSNRNPVIFETKPLSNQNVLFLDLSNQILEYTTRCVRHVDSKTSFFSMSLKDARVWRIGEVDDIEKQLDLIEEHVLESLV
mmetsp:Transcript_10921/g.19746  ORF Transcript_10921/g.19746 Transcript_10921/m.19746 type:complete len:125 (+) Transcript_10921:1255-1629(+)